MASLRAFDTFGGEVEGCRRAPGPVAPVDRPLAVAVLVEVEDAVGVLARVPELAEGQAGHAGVDVLLRELATCEA